MRFSDCPAYLCDTDNDQVWLVCARTAKEALEYYIGSNSFKPGKPSAALRKLVAETRQQYKVEQDEDNEYNLVPTKRGITYYHITAEAVEQMKKEGLIDAE